MLIKLNIIVYILSFRQVSSKIDRIINSAPQMHFKVATVPINHTISTFCETVLFRDSNKALCITI